MLEEKGGLIDSSKLAVAIGERGGVNPYKPPWYKRMWPYRLWKWLDRKLEEPPPAKSVMTGIGLSHLETQEKGRQELMKAEEIPKMEEVEETGRRCRNCDRLWTSHRKSSRCPSCGSDSFEKVPEKEVEAAHQEELRRLNDLGTY